MKDRCKNSTEQLMFENITPCFFIAKRDFPIVFFISVIAKHFFHFQNNTYIQNPGFPSVYALNTGITYTVSKCSNSEY